MYYHTNILLRWDCFKSATTNFLVINMLLITRPLDYALFVLLECSMGSQHLPRERLVKQSVAWIHTVVICSHFSDVTSWMELLEPLPTDRVPRNPEFHKQWSHSGREPSEAAIPIRTHSQTLTLPDFSTIGGGTWNKQDHLQATCHNFWGNKNSPYST